MSLPLIIRSKLFFRYKNQPDCCWYLGCGDGTTVAKQDAYINDMDKFEADTATLNICNEGISTIFSGEFMRSALDDRKCNLLVNFIRRLKARGKLVVIVFFDGPAIPNAKYPFLRFKDRIPAFLEVITGALAPIVDGFILGIETNRYFHILEVEAGVDKIQKFAVRNGVKLPVGTHEQSYRIARNADFIGYESSNHPFKPLPTSVIVAEVKTLVTKAGGKPVWLMETRADEGAECRAQNRVLAALPGVVGVGGAV